MEKSFTVDSLKDVKVILCHWDFMGKDASELSLLNQSYWKHLKSLAQQRKLYLQKIMIFAFELLQEHFTTSLSLAPPTKSTLDASGIYIAENIMIVMHSQEILIRQNAFNTS